MTSLWYTATKLTLGAMKLDKNVDILFKYDAASAFKDSKMTSVSEQASQNYRLRVYAQQN